MWSNVCINLEWTERLAHKLHIGCLVASNTRNISVNMCSLDAGTLGWKVHDTGFENVHRFKGNKMQFKHYQLQRCHHKAGKPLLACLLWSPLPTTVLLQCIPTTLTGNSNNTLTRVDSKLSLCSNRKSQPQNRTSCLITLS